MALSGGKLTGYSKIEQKDYSDTYWTTEGAMKFMGSRVSSLSKQIKSKLGEISKVYDNISDKYEKILNSCSGNGGKVDKSTTEGKALNKYKKTCDKRAEYCQKRKDTLSDAIEDARMVQVNIDNAAGQVLEDANKTSNSEVAE